MNRFCLLMNKSLPFPFLFNFIYDLVFFCPQRNVTRERTLQVTENNTDAFRTVVFSCVSYAPMSLCLCVCVCYGNSDKAYSRRVITPSSLLCLIRFTYSSLPLFLHAWPCVLMLANLAVTND